MGGFTTDPDNGNPIPITRNYQVYAYFKFGEKPPKQIAATQPSDTPYQWVSGYVVDVVDPLSPNVLLPPAMPDAIASEGIATRVGDITGIFYPVVRTPNAALETYVNPSVLGEQIWGWFDVKS